VSEQSEPAANNEPEWHRKAMATRDERLRWWREARFGMFIHWGVYSLLAGEWRGEPYSGYAEHIQRKAKIPIPVYHRKVAGKFNPTAYNPDEWAELAREAGMGYMIITAKHHDGFAMYPSKVSPHNIVEMTPFGRDPMRDLQAACKKRGIRFGFYYSHAFDWGDHEGPGNDWEFENPGGDRLLHGGREWWKSAPEMLPQVRRYVDRKSIPQIQELIRMYDPDILWFDTPGKLPPEENLRILQAVREAGPNVVVNGRLVRGMGDYINTADRPAEFPPQKGDWEAIPTTNESYGYSQFDHSHKTPEHFIRLMAKAAAGGGNLLLNIGPMGDGRIDPKDAEILRAVGTWMRTNGESIRATERTPLLPQVWGDSTRKANRLYLHVFYPPKEGTLVVGGLTGNVIHAFPLADPLQSPLVVERLNKKDVVIRLPDALPDPIDTVLVVEIDASNGVMATDQETLLLATNQPNRLHVYDGQLQGRGLRYGAGKRQDAYIYDWNQTDEYVAWPVRLNDSAMFEIRVSYDAGADSAGGQYSVTFDGQPYTGTVGEGKERSDMLGRVTLTAGQHEIRITPTRMRGSELMRLRALTLTPMSRDK
jgi:hypothetical protein